MEQHKLIILTILYESHLINLRWFFYTPFSRKCQMNSVDTLLKHLFNLFSYFTLWHNLSSYFRSLSGICRLYSGTKVFTGSERADKVRHYVFSEKSSCCTTFESIFPKNLVHPKPYTFIVPEQNQHTPAH